MENPDNFIPSETLRFLDNKGEERLKFKKRRMYNLIKIAQPDEALYREIMLSLGYKNNKVQFLELALILPYFQIRELKDRETIEKALLYRGGFMESKDGLPENFDFSLKMDKSVWNHQGVRPNNYPEKRISGISIFLAETIETGIYTFFRDKIIKCFSEKIDRIAAISIVREITLFNGIGKDRRLEIFFNIILPFYEVIFEEEGNSELVNFLNQLYEKHPPLADNSITKKVKKKLSISPNNAIDSAKRYMGLIQIYKNK